ncbi:M14 family zinc carboxypeptidase [Wocania ichthyoenteri]|uniref:M14 family zinc carboxypeptidase n=1 Tax=Wocania ichthyoenteri TaxID=1230531 RepID=UPI00053DA4C1|nr:M14 family zinc carboxypeptidase [Wocania ichthyoenteri]
MKKITLVCAIFLLIAQITFSQNDSKAKAEKYISSKGEVTFTFKVDNSSDIEKHTKDFSIVYYNPKTKIVKAWANEKQFRVFESKNIPFEVPKSENEVDEAFIYDNSSKTKKESLAAKGLANTLTFPVSSYPTYADYAQQMQDFEDDNPTLVEKISIGTTTQGDKELLFVKISDNVGTDEQEPKLMLTSSMHGDEIAGYPMMLSLINYILTVYADTGHSDHARVKNLVENAEIWINPSANPDGTYHNSPSNTSVANARRGNANNIDLNRNYPDNVQGAHTDGEVYQVETLAFMALADANHFVIAANFHGGTELVNYPFDNAYVSQYTHPDGEWFEYTGIQYATHAQNDSDAAPYNDTTYMTADDDSNVYPSPGVTHGAEWYRVYGGRQDYMNFYHQCKEITIELSDTKILPASQLDDYWYYNRDALLDFLTQGTYGFTGVVKDANTNNPIDATVTIVGHDAYGSHTVTDISHGDYYRPIKGGGDTDPNTTGDNNATATYDILFEAPCYESFTLTNQSIANDQKIVLPDVLLVPASASGPSNLVTSDISDTSVTISWGGIYNATFDYRYRVVGAPTWTTTNTSNSSEGLTGLTPSTQYEFQVRSTCNSSTSSFSNSILFTTTALPTCTGSSISSFPYSEGFESDLGSWSQAVNGSVDDIDWTRKQEEGDGDSTPSSNTGPSLASENSWFLFTEASTNVSPVGSPNKSAHLISPCFELSGYENAQFTFDTHMYGANIDGTASISLDISIDNGSNYTNLFTNNIQQQTANADPWTTQTINLSAYDGQTIKLRINAVTGGGFASDIAIDNINLTADVITSTTWYQDADSDTFGNPSVSQVAVSQPAGYVANNTDCDDTDDTLHPNTVWYLGVDADGDSFFGSQLTATQCTNPGGYSLVAPTLDDCDDTDDTLHPNTVWYLGVDADGDSFFGSQLTATQCTNPGGYSLVAPTLDDCDDTDDTLHPNTVWYLGVDADGDSFFGSQLTATQCTNPGGYSLVAPTLDDCDDTDDTLHPNTVWYLGVDADGDSFFGSQLTATQCTNPGGYSLVAPTLDDCDDTDDTLHPNTVWYLGVDADGDSFFGSQLTATQCTNPGGYSLVAPTLDDCDDTDDTLHPNTVWYLGVDADGDSFFGSQLTATQCTNPGGYSLVAPTLDDCDDTDDTLHPNTVWYLGVDADGDSFFGSQLTATQCTNPGGYSLVAPTLDDCDDTDDTLHPNTVWYLGVDADGDSFFGSQLTATQCTNPGGYSLVAPTLDDCDDTDPSVNPGATEIPSNGIDDDCNAATPDGALDIDDDFNLNNVLISPNPFNNNLSIKLPLSYNNSEFKIKIFDLNGRLVFNKRYSSINGTINVSNLNKLDQAPYLLKIISNETGLNIIRRLIKY